MSRPARHYEALKDDLKSMIERNQDLKDGVTMIDHHFLVQRDQNIACATATFHTSISANELVKKLNRARDGHRYHFDVNFQNITPL